jgi:hypothetical protein
LLTVTVLGGACFGLPTALVSERERGVWRRFRLTPARTGALLSTTLIARYLLLLTAGLLQVVLAMGVFGMPMPRHPLDLLVAFTFVAFAFMGLGLVIAMLADTVPAVQALGQCIFLPMLVIGGVAVRIESLPEWAQHLSAYFPGRYAVEAMQVSTTGEGLGVAGFALLALLLIGAAGCVAGAKMFRWDQHQRFARLDGKGWVGVALVAWIAVGVTAQTTGRVAVGVPLGAGGGTLADAFSTPIADAEPPGTALPPPAPDTLGEVAPDTMAADTTPPERAEEEPALPAPAPADPTPAPAPAQPWQAVTMQQIESFNYAALPPDDGVVAPIGSLDEPIYPETLDLLQCMRVMLQRWPAGLAVDPVQRVRNYLYVAAVPDMFQMEELERWVPLVIFEHLRGTMQREDLMKILYWIGANPNQGDVSASAELRGVCVDIGGPSDIEMLRERTAYYAMKLLGRMVGRIPSS